jgi:hypothetical protein
MAAPVHDIVRSSLAAHQARDGRPLTAIAELIWGQGDDENPPWADLEPLDRKRKRNAGSGRLSKSIARGWICDVATAQGWADALGVSVEALLFHGARPT